MDGKTADARPAAARVARNTALRAATDTAGKLAGVVLFAYIARKLGEHTLGEFVFALSLGQIIYSVAGFGLDRMALRDIAREHDAVERIFWDMTAIKLAIGIAGVGACVLGVWALDYSNTAIALVAVLGSSLVISVVVSGPMAVFQAHEQMEYYAYAALPVKLLTSALGIGALLAGGGIVMVAFGQLVAAAAGVAVGFALMFKHFARPRMHVQTARWPQLARAAAPFGVQESLGQVIYRINTVLLALFTTASVVGSFGAGFRLLEATMFIGWSVGSSVLPMFSYIKRGDSPSLDRVYEGSLKLVTIVLLPIAIAMLVCARPIVNAIYGLPEFSETVVVLRWLAMATVIYAVGHLAGILVLVRRPGRLTVITMAIVAAVNVVLNVALIPSFEAAGAAAATLASEVLLAGFGIYLARTVAGRPRPVAVAGAAVTASAAMAGAMIPLADRLELALPAGALVYTAILLLVESKSLSGDLDMVRTILRRRGPAPPVAGRPPA